MKKYLFLVSAIMAFCLGSCTKDDTISNLGATTGDEIKFVASITDNTTRTVYGDKTGDSYPLYWVTGDKVAVYSPQALSAPISGEVDASQTYAGPADVTYTVGTTSNSNTYALSGEAANLYWGTGEGNNGTHEFYTFYPSRADRIYKKDTDGTFVVTVPREQNATVTQNGDTYTAVDMSAAIMAGYTTVDRNTYNGEEIVLPFTPLTTAFDIEILPPTNNLPEGTTGIDAVTITSITIANPSEVTTNRKILAGGFNYNAKTGAFSHYTNTSTTNTEDANAYTVNIQLSKPVTLESGSNQKLIVTGFLLPHIMYASGDTTDTTLRIMINCREGENSGAMKVHSKDITWTNANKATFEMKKSTVKLGELPNPIVFSYETWMANLPDNTYVSQISMPGTHDAGAYETKGITNLLAGTQGMDIPTQFDSGVRVLDFRPDYNDGDWDISHGLVTLDVTFDEVLSAAVAWLAEHPTEFIIIQLKNEGTLTSLPDFLGGGWILYKNFVGFQNHVREVIGAVNPQYNIVKFNPSLTLKDARGKLVFMSRDDYDIAGGNTSNKDENSSHTYHGDWIGCKIAGWPDNNNDSVKPWYRNIMTMYDNTNKQYGVAKGVMYVSDLYDGPSDVDKKSAIVKSFENAKAKTGIVDNWCMTWLNITSGLSGKYTGTYNSYAAEYIMGTTKYNEAFGLDAKNGFAGMSQQTYENAGIVMIDWASNSLSDDDYHGYKLIKAVVDNNFKGGGPKKKTN